MNIAIDIRNIGRGRTGSEVVVRELTRALVVADHAHTYFLITDTDDASVRAYITRVFDLVQHTHVKIVSLPSYGRGGWVLWSVWRFLRRAQIDLFHTEYIVPFFIPRHVRVITHVHDVSFKAMREKIGKKDLFFLDLLMPRSLRRADAIIAVSAFTQREIEKYYPFARGKVVMIHNACSTRFAGRVTDEEVQRVRTKYHLPSDYILAIGTMQPRKNIPFLITAFAQIANRLPDVQLVLTGKQGHHYDTIITDTIQAYPALQGRVTFTGFVDDEDLPAMYAGAHVFAYPSLYEGFGLPILEAFSQDTPTIVSDIPVHHEIAADGALYGDPHDVDQWSEVLYHVYTRQQTRHDLIARAQVQGRLFSWHKSAHTFLHIINHPLQAEIFQHTTMKTSIITKIASLSLVSKIVLGVLIAFFLIGGGLFWKAESVTSQLTTKGSLISSVGKKLSLQEDVLQGEQEGRINIAILGMRGKGLEGGGELADTIMVLSVIRTNDDVENPTYSMSLISIPRDLFVTMPHGAQSKINAVYYEGEQKGEGQGLEQMKIVLSDILGQPVHYAASINFQAFSDIVDALGGVEITRTTEFVEPVQFNEMHVCDGDNGGVFTVPTGTYEIKYKEDGRIKSQYPYCTNENPECGGVFTVPAGTTNLTGEQALCYVRARATSSDFDRARRQQEVLGELRKKATTLGILGSLGKVNDLIAALGDNVQVDVEPWEMQRFFDLYDTIGSREVQAHKVLENSEEGLLYAPAESDVYGYILLPRGDNYDRIHEAFRAMLDTQ